MRCEECQGSGRKRAARLLYDRDIPAGWYVIPCPSCGGSGIASCCDGMVGCAFDVTNLPSTAERREQR